MFNVQRSIIIDYDDIYPCFVVKHNTSCFNMYETIQEAMLVATIAVRELRDTHNIICNLYVTQSACIKGAEQYECE
jgi:hypothetical protein